MGLTLALVAGACGSDQVPAPGTGSDGGTDTDAGSGTDGGSTGGSGPSPEDCAPVILETLDEPGARSFDEVFTKAEIPGLADQPTDAGTIIRSLAGFDGALHMGFGDYSANTGPIPMFSMDPETEVFVPRGIVGTEQVFGFAVGEATLYASNIDPDAHEGEGGAFRLGCGEPEWEEGAIIEGAIHVYDATLSDGLLWVGTGSHFGAPARLMSSDDRGDTWVEELRRESPADRFTRFYFLGGAPGLMYVSGRVEPAPVETFAYAGLPGTFNEVPNVPETGHTVPLVFADELLVVHFSGNPGISSHLGTYRVGGDDSLQPETVFPGDGLRTWAMTPGAGTVPALLWALVEGADGTSVLHRTADLEMWDEVTVLPAPEPGDQYSAIAPLLNQVYVGTRLGSLHVVREVDAPAG